MSCDRRFLAIDLGHLNANERQTQHRQPYLRYLALRLSRYLGRDLQELGEFSVLRLEVVALIT